MGSASAGDVSAVTYSHSLVRPDVTAAFKRCLVVSGSKIMKLRGAFALYSSFAVVATGKNTQFRELRYMRKIYC